MPPDENWIEEVTANLDYYLKTPEGMLKLLELAKRESKKREEEVLKQYRSRRDIIWISRHCYNCRYFSMHGSRMRCIFWNVKLVKPFYGRPLLSLSFDELGRPLVEVSDVEWEDKWADVEEELVEMAIDRINGGRPYFCYETK